MTGPDIGEHRVTRCLALLFCLTFATPAVSEPTPQQISAIRSACVSDFMANCSGVQPGGADALACLQRNVANLSANCQAAVNAAGAPAVPAAPAAPPGVAATPQPAPSPPAPAVASPALPRPPSYQQQAAIRNACRSDFIANCTGVQPGGPEALACLQVNAARLSSACRRAVAAVGRRGRAATRRRRCTSSRDDRAASDARVAAACVVGHSSALSARHSHQMPAAAGSRPHRMPGGKHVGADAALPGRLGTGARNGTLKMRPTPGRTSRAPTLVLVIGQAEAVSASTSAATH